MAARFEFEHSLAFAPDHAAEILRSIPALPGVFALHGPPAPAGQPPAQPYLTRAADLRRRITRLLAPPESQSKRLNLRSRVARIDYNITGSDFESTLTLYHASAAVFGLDEARRRLRLRTPFFLRFAAENAYPRVYSTNRLSKRALANFYGPFPSRAAADRCCDAVLDLFKLRRCVEDLAPYPEHPGCVYGEMNKCLAPCNQACTPGGAATYAAEAAAVHAFFETHGESMLAPLTAGRERASAELDFERAAELHAQWQKVKAAAALAHSLVQPIPRLRAILLQKSAQPTRTSEKPGAPHLDSEMWVDEAASSLSSRSAGGVPGERSLLAGVQAEGSASPGTATECEPAAAVFLLQSGCITGPARLSTLGVRAVKEQTAVGSSLFAQPLMLQAIPLAGDAQPAEIAAPLTPADSPGAPHLDSEMWVPTAESPSAVAAPFLSFRSGAEESASPAPASESPALSPEARAAALIAALESEAPVPTAGAAQPDLATLSDHLSLLRRWYYRPEKQRAGEIFFPREDSAGQTAWPIRRILNAAARIALGDPKPLADTRRNPEPARASNGPPGAELI